MSGDKLSVLHVSQPTEYGVAMCVAAFARDQVRRGWRVTVACPPGGWLMEAAKDGGASHITLEATRGIGPSMVAEVRRLDRVVSVVDPCVVHLHSSKAGLVGRLAIRGRRATLFQPHAWSFPAVDPWLRRAAVAWERWACRWTDVIVCCSESEADQGREAGVSGNTVVVPNALDPARLAEMTGHNREEARRRLGLGSEPLAVCIGRLAAQKGQDMLLKAWPDVKSSVPTARLAVVGDGPARSELATMATSGVELTGWRSDVGLWLASADVVVIPSRYEGMSLTLLEAMASGRSVVSFDVAGVGEVFRRARRPIGRAVAPSDLDALAGAIIDRLSDEGLSEAEGAAARAYVLEEHSPDRWLDRIAELTLSLSTTAAGQRST